MRFRLGLLAAVFLVWSGGAGLYALSDFYWEQPEVFSPASGSFPVSASNGVLAAVAWQESDPADAGGGGHIRVPLAVKVPGKAWKVYPSVAGPYAYAGTEPAILSIAVDDRGRILIAAAASSTLTELLISDDEGETFRSIPLESGAESSVAPRIFARGDGGYLLFVTRSLDQSFSIYYTRSNDGLRWSAFEPFVEDAALSLNFLPIHAAKGLRDYVVFQSLAGGEDSVPAFQLFMQSSADGGLTWTAPRLITDFQDPYRNARSAPERFDNQRPHLSLQNDRLFLVWERRYGMVPPHIYGAFLGDDGAVQGPVELVNTDSAYCGNPVAFSYEGQPTVVWFDNRRGGNRIFLAQKGAVDWRNIELSGPGGDAVFARPVVSGKELFLLWQRNSGTNSRIYALAPDTSAPAPRLTGENFIPGARNRGDRVRISWQMPSDSSGIQGFSYCWSQDPLAAPEERLLVSSGVTAIEQTAPEDGSWYFALRALDFAGNWSHTSRIEYVRDTVPPPAAAVIPPDLDEAGYLRSNTFSLRWNPPPASDIAGYAWDLEYLGAASPFASLDADDFLAAAAERFSRPAAAERLNREPAPPVQNRGPETAAAFDNQDDGVWRFSVSALDEVGNAGPPSSVFFRTNKYVPHTYVTFVDAAQDEQGVLTVRIIGRGFADGGLVTRIFLDRDGKAPYDREYYLERGDYRVLSDREIAGLRIDDIDPGLYHLGLDHPLRGRYQTPPLAAVDEKGTVKFGDYSQGWEPSWTFRPERSKALDMTALILMGMALFALLGLAASLRGISAALAEAALIRIEAEALLTGDVMPSERKKRLTGIRRRGGGLRVKLASFTIVLVNVVVGMVSAPLYMMMTRTQEETLLRGLWDRSMVLLDGLALSARTYLPLAQSGNVLELAFLPDRSVAIPEARYVTITGLDDAVWATNDPDILSKIDTAELQIGVSLITDTLSPRVPAVTEEINRRARAAVGSLSESIASLTQEALSLASRTDTDSARRMEDLQVSIRSLEVRLSSELENIGRMIGSEPAFSLRRHAQAGRYIFFKPVLYRRSADDIYFRGLIRLEVALDSILEQLSFDRMSLLRVILLVALSALTIGVVGALVLAALIIGPIRKLVSHVELIRDTEDKSKLEGVDIAVRSRDELAVLGSTINDMTHGLVKAAQAASDLTIGKEVQKKFIPLDLDQEGNKLTSGAEDAQNVEFFGYYEGAKGVSGDYFDYLDLDGRYYAIIKCDVAGKGIPAALIMIQVATMFLNYFKTWKPDVRGMHIEQAVYQINDFIEALGFKGRFAAFTLALLDSYTGIIRFCNAGDNIVHWFDASEGRMKTLTLPETPAAGVLPNILVESKGGYPVQTLTLDHGDVLFLYTDGIEEAKRKFRDGNFHEIHCTEGPDGSPHANHVAGQGDEELGSDRVEAIINAVMNRGSYILHKYHNPEGESALGFDFADCGGRVEDAIMAMVSVEKMFRLYKTPFLTGDDRVAVDKKVDVFLRDHFAEYRNYCSQTREFAAKSPYMYYTHVMEDPQYDDLTIIGIKRK